MQSAVKEMMDEIVNNGNRVDFTKYLQMERDQIQNAVIHGLEQFAHGNDWKVFIAQNYYNEQYLKIKGLPGGDK
jgi:hypothetical protein